MKIERCTSSMGAAALCFVLSALYLVNGRVSADRNKDNRETFKHLLPITVNVSVQSFELIY